MVSGTTRTDIIVKTELGEGTGDMRYQTNDGKWWTKWHGEDIGTGDEIRELHSE